MKWRVAKLIWVGRGLFCSAVIGLSLVSSIASAEEPQPPVEIDGLAAHRTNKPIAPKDSCNSLDLFSLEAAVGTDGSFEGALALQTTRFWIAGFLGGLWSETESTTGTQRTTSRAKGWNYGVQLNGIFLKRSKFSGYARMRYGASRFISTLTVDGLSEDQKSNSKTGTNFGIGILVPLSPRLRLDIFFDAVEISQRLAANDENLNLSFSPRFGIGIQIGTFANGQEH